MRNYLCLTIVVALAAGCSNQKTLPRTTWSADEFVAGTAGHSVRGVPIAYEVWGHGPETVMISASIHGNEAAGTPLLHRLSSELRARPDALRGRRVVLIPAVNPDGVADGQRYNANGVDLNRNFPATNWRKRAHHGAAPLSEPETRAVHDLFVRYRPARIISIHQPIGCVDYDGPAAPLARAMSASAPLPVRRLGARAGSLGSFTGLELQIPTITLELPGAASNLDANELWDRYGQMLIAAIEFTDTQTLVSRDDPSVEAK